MAADPAIGRADARGGPTIATARPRAYAEDLFGRHGERILAYCRRRLPAQEAEDALQTTFLYACRGLQRGVVPESEIAWLLKIAHNVCLSQWDANRRRRRLELARDPERLDAVTPAVQPSDRESLLALEGALGDLTDQQRRAIVLREWRGLSYQEIAAELQISQSAVETLIFRARRALARSLEREEQPRSRLARCLDVGGLVPALKSALGLGGNTKVAASLALGAAVLAGSIPDVPKRTPVEASRPPAVEATRAAPEPSVIVDPPTAPGVRAAARGQRAETDVAPKRAPRARRGPEKRSRTGGGGESGALPSLENVTDGLGETVTGVTKQATGAVEDVLETDVPDLVSPVEDVGTVVGSGGGGLP